MYCAFARFEEVKELKVPQLDLDGEDVVITFSKGKTYQFGEARQSVMPGISTEAEAVTPVGVLKGYVDRLKLIEGNKSLWLFPGLRMVKGELVSLNKPASYDAVAKDFKKVVKEAGLVASNGGEFGLHSMRRGAVTEAVNAGADEHSVMKQMRVVSASTVRRYATLKNDVLRKAARAAL